MASTTVGAGGGARGDGDITSADSRPIVVVGAGLAGSMMALMLAKRGMKVELYEKRPDFRVEEREEAEKNRHLGQSRDPTKRSINLALSHRGLTALRSVGLADTVLAGCIDMPCRAIHSPAGAVSTQPYGRPGDAIYSASRSLLNTTLLDACEGYRANLTIFHDYGLKSVGVDGTAVFEHGRDQSIKRVPARCVIGADGAYSAVRNAMLRASRMDFSRKYIEHGYKELNMPPGPDGGWAMPIVHALHIWPRHKFMMIALPNPDRTFTCTLFLPWDVLESLDADVSKVRPFFQTHFQDAIPLIPELEKQFATNPSSALVMTRCDPWNVGDKMVLIGDAAHAVVPFYGQGANAAFEDCLVFNECLDACAGDMSRAVPLFAATRKPAGDALGDLSLANYVEMRHKTATWSYLVQKQVEAALYWLLPSVWIPQYSMVSFTRIPYNEVQRRARQQEAILTWSAVGVATTTLVVVAVVAARKGYLHRAATVLANLWSRWAGGGR